MPTRGAIAAVRDLSRLRVAVFIERNPSRTLEGMADVTVTMSRGAAQQLDRLLQIMERAGANPTGEPVTMEVLNSAGFTNGGLGEAHNAIRKALG